MAQITCRYCGTTVETSRSQRVRCGADACRRAYIRETTAAWRAKMAKPRPPRACRECGSSFTDLAGWNQQYCSFACSRASHLRQRREREYRPAPRTCDFCGGEIPSRSGKRRYCSAECQKAGIAREARWRIKGLPPGVKVSTVCELCGASDRVLKIDHDHACCPGGNACGKCFRGMLCHSCNVALGMFHDSPEELRRAAAYIEQAKTRTA